MTRDSSKLMAVSVPDPTPTPAWPPPVGTVFTLTVDGVEYPNCIVRHPPCVPGPYVWYDNGDPENPDYTSNGATVGGWAAEHEVTYG